MLALMFAGPAGAQTSDQGYTLVQSIKIYDALVEFPPPSWYQGKDPLGFSEIHQEQKGPQFVMEHIPKGERFDSWTKIYTLRGTYLGPRQKVSLDSYVSSGIAPYAQACGRKNLYVQSLVPDGNSQTILVYCENSPNGPAAIGYGPGIGFISLSRFFSVKHTLLKVAQEWRGPAFLAQDPSTWPTSQAEIDMMAKRFATMLVHEDRLPQ